MALIDTLKDMAIELAGLICACPDDYDLPVPWEDCSKERECEDCFRYAIELAEKAEKEGDKAGAN